MGKNRVCFKEVGDVGIREVTWINQWKDELLVCRGARGIKIKVIKLMWREGGASTNVRNGRGVEVQESSGVVLVEGQARFWGHEVVGCKRHRWRLESWR